MGVASIARPYIQKEVDFLHHLQLVVLVLVHRRQRDDATRGREKDINVTILPNAFFYS